MQSVVLARAPVDTEFDRSATDHIRLLPDWEPAILAHEVQVFPPVAFNARRKFLSSSTLMILSTLEDIDSRRRKGVRQKSGVCIKDPGGACRRGNSRGPGDPGDEGSNKGSDAGSDAGSDLGDPGDEDSNEGSDADLVRAPIDVGALVGERQERQHLFGPWSISEVWSKKVQVGWGANCGQHFGVAGLACKKNITALAGVDNGLDEAKRLCKGWLLLGRQIKCHDCDGRRKHVLEFKRGDIPLRSHEELDREAAALL